MNTMVAFCFLIILSLLLFSISFGLRFYEGRRRKSLVSMLRTVQYAWQQQALSENARAVFDLGRELYDRLAGLGRHLERVGRSLTSAVGSYNQAVGALESRVLVSARKLSALGVVDGELPAPGTIADTARPLAAPEFVDGDREPELLP